MLQQRAMLACVSIARWTASKNDKKVSDEVDANHGADKAGRYTKLLIDKSHIKALATSAGNIRKFHYGLTLPWDDEGPRLLPAKSFMKYNDGLRKLTAEDERLRNEFFKVYPSLVAAAPARLGTLYNASDFPAVSELPKKYDIKVVINTVPNAQDFRVDVGNEAAEQIKASINAENDLKFQMAMKSCYQRVSEVVSHISSKMKEEDPRIFNTLVTNAEELVSCLVDLNLADDPQLEQIRCDLKAMLPRSAQALKDDPVRRKQMAEDADAILEKLKGVV